MSWGDLYLVAISDYLNFMLGFDMFEKYPNLSGLRDKVVSVPSIAAWIKKRPVT